MSTDLATKPVASITEFVEMYSPKISEVLGEQFDMQRFARLMVGCFRKTPKLQGATQVSLIDCFMACAVIRLEPNTPAGECFIIPYTDRKAGVVNATFQMGYQGFLTVAARNNIFATSFDLIKKGDEWGIVRGTKPQIIHRYPRDLVRGEVLGGYCVHTFPNGTSGFTFMSREEIDVIEARALKNKRNKSESPWTTDQEQMQLKTVIKRDFKTIPGKSEDLALAVSYDGLHEGSSGVVTEMHSRLGMPVKALIPEATVGAPAKPTDEPEATDDGGLD